MCEKHPMTIGGHTEDALFFVEFEPIRFFVEVFPSVVASALDKQRQRSGGRTEAFVAFQSEIVDIGSRFDIGIFRIYDGAAGGVCVDFIPWSLE